MCARVRLVSGEAVRRVSAGAPAPMLGGARTGVTLRSREIPAMTDTETSKSSTRDERQLYWRTNLRYLAVLLTTWFLVSYGCGILFVDWLNGFRLPGTGFKLGFWFAQQGSTYVFVVLIFVYVLLMNRLDHRFDVDES